MTTQRLPQAPRKRYGVFWVNPDHLILADGETEWKPHESHVSGYDTNDEEAAQYAAGKINQEYAGSRSYCVVKPLD